MPISKKKHPKKRRKQANPKRYSGYIGEISFGGLDISDDLKSELRAAYGDQFKIERDS